jgi:hypothetical protein
MVILMMRKFHLMKEREPWERQKEVWKPLGKQQAI